MLQLQLPVLPKLQAKISVRNFVTLAQKQSQIKNKSSVSGLLIHGKLRNSQEITSKAVTSLLAFPLEARCLFSFFKRVSYNINCIEGLLTCRQQGGKSVITQQQLLESLLTYHDQCWENTFPKSPDTSFTVNFMNLHSKKFQL